MNDGPAEDGVAAGGKVRAAPAGLLRRLAAIVYDALAVFAVLYFATAPLLLLTGGEAVPSAHPGYRLYLALVAFLYFAWCWTHGGQTLGMRAWRLRATTASGAPIGWKLASARFALAGVSWLCLGLGFLWALADRERLTWHDRATGTRIVHLPKR